MTQRKTLEDLAEGTKKAYKTVEDMVHYVVREGIVLGIYEPGERLPQDQIAETMGVSRIPVRAALRRLEAEGFVDFVAHRGATVSALTPSEVAEIYDLRILLETYAIRSAAERVTDEELDELEALAEMIEQTEDSDEWLALRQRFYDHLYAIANRPRSAELIGKLRADVGRYWLMQRVTEGHVGQSHTVIVAALRKRSPSDAERWLREHLSEVSTELQRRMKEDTGHP